MSEAMRALSAFVLLPSEGRVLVPGGVVLKASGNQTGEAFEVLELHGPSGPPPHVASDSKGLVFVVPGGLEGFFTELATGMAAGTSQADIREALEAKYDSHPA